MIERLSPTKRNVVLGVLGVLLLWFCWSIRSVINPLLVGYLAAWILHPWVKKLEQRGMKRRNAVNLIFLVCFLGTIVVTLLLAMQFRDLAGDVILDDKVQARVQEKLDVFSDTVREYLPVEDDWSVQSAGFDDLRQMARGWLEEYGEVVQSAAGASARAAGGALRFAGRFLGAVVTIAGYFVLVPLYAYYMLFLLGSVHEFVARYLPKRDRQQLVNVAAQIGEVLANFFRGRLGACFLKGLFLSIGLAIAGIDYAFLFGMTSGFLSLIPFIGPALGFVVAAMVGVLEHGVVGSLIRTGIVFGLGELLEGYVIIPKVLGDSLGLHPVVVLFSMLAGGAALGTLGILISLPLTASVVILFKEFVVPALRQFADEDRGKAPGSG